MTKPVQKKAPIVEVVPPPNFVRSGDLRLIDGVLHQRYIPHANIGGDAEHWQPVEEWETEKDGTVTRTDLT